MDSSTTTTIIQSSTVVSTTVSIIVWSVCTLISNDESRTHKLKVGMLQMGGRASSEATSMYLCCGEGCIQTGPRPASPPVHEILANPQALPHTYSFVAVSASIPFQDGFNGRSDSVWPSSQWDITPRCVYFLSREES